MRQSVFRSLDDDRSQIPSPEQIESSITRLAAHLMLLRVRRLVTELGSADSNPALTDEIEKLASAAEVLDCVLRQQRSE